VGGGSFLPPLFRVEIKLFDRLCVTVMKGDFNMRNSAFSFSGQIAKGFVLIGIWVLVFSGLVVANDLSRQTDPAKYEKLKSSIQSRLDEWHKKANFPGATVGVTLANGDSFGVATGYSNRKSKTPMKPTDVMMAGSVGKTYVAATALRLVYEKKFGLDDNISRYLGDEEWFERLPNSKDIKIRHLMNHTSGLVRYEMNPAFLKDMLANPDKVWKPREQISYLFDSKAAFEPGMGWDYSDTNYIVLGIILEKITGKKYYEIAKQRILTPLKLNKTQPQISRVIDGLISGYAGKGHQFGGEDEMIQNGKYVFNPQWEWTGGGMVTNSVELSRWGKAMYEGKAFPKEMLAEMLVGTDAPALGPGAKYGLGVIIRKTPKGLTYGHSGFFPGYYTDLMYFPEHKIAVAIQINSTVFKDIGRNPAGVLVEVMGVIEEEHLAKEKAKPRSN